MIDHLPGGMYKSVIDPQVIQETKSVPKTNVTPERDFAVLDRLMHRNLMRHILHLSRYFYILIIKLLGK